MTCKDCIHYEVCGSLGMEVYRWGRKPTLQIFLDKFKAEHCTRFKPSSRFVELPCKVGNTVYFIKGGRVMSDVVTGFVIDRCDVRVRKSNGADVGHASQFGTRIFLTRKEAEQALKERETK